MSGIRLTEVAAATIPTPPTGTATIFLETADGEPKYKDDTGTVNTLTGATGATGAQGDPGAAGDMTNPMTTAGDIIKGGASGTPERLALGAALQHLRVNAGATALEYADPPAGGGSSHVGEGSGATVVDTDTAIGASPLSVSATVADGDLMIISGMTTNSIPNVNGPNGDSSWNLIVRQDTSSSEFHFVYWKIASGETGTWTLTHSAGTEVAMALVVYRGVNTIWTQGYIDNSYTTQNLLGHPEGLLVTIFMTASAGGTDLAMPSVITQDAFVQSATTNKSQVIIGHRDTYAEMGSSAFTATSTANIGFAGAVSIVFYNVP